MCLDRLKSKREQKRSDTSPTRKVKKFEFSLPAIGASQSWTHSKCVVELLQWVLGWLPLCIIFGGKRNRKTVLSSPLLPLRRAWVAQWSEQSQRQPFRRWLNANKKPLAARGFVHRLLLIWTKRWWCGCEIGLSGCWRLRVPTHWAGQALMTKINVTLLRFVNPFLQNRISKTKRMLPMPLVLWNTFSPVFLTLEYSTRFYWRISLFSSWRGDSRSS